MTSPGAYDFTIYQGANLDFTATWLDDSDEPINLTGWDAEMQARPRVDAELLLFALSVGNGITLGDAEGTIQIQMDAEETSALDFDRGVYNLELISPPGQVTRLLEGTVRLSKEVTREPEDE